jgi:enoyl-CoA hydratase
VGSVLNIVNRSHNSMPLQEHTRGQAPPHIAIDRTGALGRIVLDRPEALNALTAAMRAAIAAAMPGFARDPVTYAVLIKSTCPRAFSAGGDIREISAAARERPAEARAWMRQEYALNWLLECFSKPTVSLIDGMVMGSGVGISIYGTHRVAGEGYSFAMPETAVGLFPDDGVASVFARMPNEIGTYLGLTGRRIGRADAYRLGLATHCVGRQHFTRIEQALSEADPVDEVLDALHGDPGPAALDGERELVERHFSAPTVEEILASLAAGARRTGAESRWCEAVLADLDARSPTSLKITLRHIREARDRDLRHTLMVDYRLGRRCLEGHDFHEGVRAALIDKDHKPRWRPDRLEDVTQAMVDRYFAPLPGDELVLPTRQEMQSQRV